MYEIMKHIRNFFAVESVRGEWKIENGVIALPFLYEGQYFLTEGSLKNDYIVHKYGERLEDETFEGYIVALNVPKPFVELCNEIKIWEATPENKSVYTSESFGGYSYTKATGSNGAPLGWQGVFKERLNAWRKI